jgi:hypothetical protein
MLWVVPRDAVTLTETSIQLGYLAKALSLCLVGDIAVNVRRDMATL